MIALKVDSWNVEPRNDAYLRLYKWSSWGNRRTRRSDRRRICNHSWSRVDNRPSHRTHPRTSSTALPEIYVGTPCRKNTHFWLLPTVGKVMFSEASASHSVHGEWGVCPPHPTWYWHLVAATAAVGTHPTGMHSCWWCISKVICWCSSSTWGKKCS